MDIDPRLNDIDDCLYRVAARVLIVQNNKVLLVKELLGDDWWALPGGGIDHGETIEASMLREIEEELGVPSHKVSSDFEIVHYNIGNVVNNVPRMNLYIKATISKESLGATSHIAQWQWFTKDEFFTAPLHASFDKQALAAVIWQ